MTSLTWICHWEADSNGGGFSFFFSIRNLNQRRCFTSGAVGGYNHIYLCGNFMIPFQVCFGGWCHLHGAAYKTGGCWSLQELEELFYLPHSIFLAAPAVPLPARARGAPLVVLEAASGVGLALNPVFDLPGLE